MRYCNHCRRITTGDPLFCNHCGRTYDVKLCPHRHVNPRSAEICSQCGSRDLSTPQPRTPLWRAPLLVLLSVLPGVVLVLVSVLFLFGLLNVLLLDQQLPLHLVVVGLFLGLVWWLYLQLPGFLRRALSSTFRRSRKGGDGR
jgi:RNA polymerase subunit RPABC4/transcription elongation factor Spt4